MQVLCVPGTHTSRCDAGSTTQGRSQATKHDDPGPHYAGRPTELDHVCIAADNA